MGISSKEPVPVKENRPKDEYKLDIESEFDESMHFEEDRQQVKRLNKNHRKGSGK